MSCTRLLSMACVGMTIVLLDGCAAGSPAKNQSPPPAPQAELKHVPPSVPNPLMTVEEVEKAHLESDIGMVHPTFSMFPWLQFDATDSRPQGVAIGALYLISNKTERGVFGDGVITVRMYRIDHPQEGREVRTLVHTWEFNPKQAMPYRSHRRTVFGEGYGLFLQWPAGTDVINREIMVVVEFVRPDGKVISAKPKFLRVPEKVNG